LFFVEMAWGEVLADGDKLTRISPLLIYDLRFAMMRANAGALRRIANQYSSADNFMRGE